MSQRGHDLVRTWERAETLLGASTYDPSPSLHRALLVNPMGNNQYDSPASVGTR